MTYININEIKDAELKNALKVVKRTIRFSTCDECELVKLCDQLPQCTSLCEIIRKGAQK